MMGRTSAILSLLTVLSVGCRPSPGDPHYEDYNYPKEDGGMGFLSGPDPYEPGESRLSLGVFYEGEYSETLAKGDGTWHYYIYINEAEEGSPQTYNQVIDTDRVEGLLSDRIIHAGYGWWGGGVHLDAPISLGGWSVLYLSLKSNDEAFAEVSITLGGQSRLAKLSASSYGYVNDGEWHDLAIPLSDFEKAGADLESIDNPFSLTGTLAGLEGEILKVDNVYMTDDKF